jgi:hypothetical protein
MQTFKQPEKTEEDEIERERERGVNESKERGRFISKDSF